MRRRVNVSTLSSHLVSRRNFLAQTAAAALGVTIVPRRVLGGPGYVPPSDKVNIAFIGVGAQGLRVMLRFLREPDVQGVAVCDANQSSAGYPQWDTHEFCKSVRELLRVDSGWDWLSPDQPIPENRRRLLRKPAAFGTVSRLRCIYRFSRPARKAA